MAITMGTDDGALAGLPVRLNNLARRQEKESPYSHYEGPERVLLETAAACLGRARPGFKPGVLLVPVPVAGFYSGVCLAGERTALAAAWVRRREGEDPYIQVTAVDAPKLPARAAELVVYSHEALGADASTDAPWEVVSINARPTLEEEPQHPLSMARNLLGRPGGTPGEYAFAQLAQSVFYWGRRVMARPAPQPLSGPDFPPLSAGLVSPEGGGEPFVLAFAEDTSLLPPPASPQPPWPALVARRGERHAGGGKGPEAAARALAESIYYWSRRPLPLARAGGMP